MTARRLAAAVCFAAALVLLGVAALTPLRAGSVAELDAEAQRLGEEWAAATDADESARLLRESNEAFARARDLEPPLAPLRALGFALLAVAGGVALWPSARSEPDDALPER